MRLVTAANRRATAVSGGPCGPRGPNFALCSPTTENPPRPVDRRSRPDTELRAWAGDPFRAASVLRRRLLAGPGRAFRLHLLLRVRVGEEVGPAPLEVRQARQVVFCSRCANADAVSSPMSLFERGRLDAVAGSWPGCGRAKRLSQKRLSQRSVPSSPNRAYRMPRCSRYSTAARIWRQRPTSFSRRFQATLEHRWRGPRRRAGPQILRAVVLAQGQEPLSQGDRGKLAHARTSCPESWRGGPATNVADVARGQPAPPA